MNELLTQGGVKCFLRLTVSELLDSSLFSQLPVATVLEFEGYRGCDRKQLRRSKRQRPERYLGRLCQRPLSTIRKQHRNVRHLHRLQARKVVPVAVVMDRSTANGGRMDFSGGFRLKLKRLVYSVMRRVGIADYGLIFSCPLQRLLDSQGLCDRSIQFEELPPSNCASLQECNPEIPLQLFATLDRRRFRCCVLRMENTCVGYAWIGLGDIPAEHNSNGHEWTGLPLALDESTAYLFAAYVDTRLRGKRLYQNLLCCIARSLESEGIERIVLTVDLKNEPAIKAVQRIGFELIGETAFFRGFGLRHASYRVDESFAPCELRKYVGDR